MNNYRTLTTVAVLALSAFAANAQSNNAMNYGEGDVYPAAVQSTPSTLTREAVIAELVSARANGTLPRDGNWSNVPAPLAMSGQSNTTVTRSEVRAEAIAAARANETAIGNN